MLKRGLVVLAALIFAVMLAARAKANAQLAVGVGIGVGVARPYGVVAVRPGPYVAVPGPYVAVAPGYVYPPYIHPERVFVGGRWCPPPYAYRHGYPIAHPYHYWR